MMLRGIVLQVKLKNERTPVLATHFLSLIYVNLKANCPHTGNYQRAPLEAKHSKSARAHQTKGSRVNDSLLNLI
ncbi:hypothetical protein ACOMICROBIO_LMKGKHOH_01065 [Vibrio sp. B1FIG11]|nr:hypothetical protein ACOMICROBIO_LMKGKHOH_01065 [Vibrio sp. B1FIG11]CAE6884566.1 hypothetical protein ACOMICROBIO_LMKGKHOH_01065 [Vibrio sp. B1FIG11]